MTGIIECEFDKKPFNNKQDMWYALNDEMVKIDKAFREYENLLRQYDYVEFGDG